MTEGVNDQDIKANRLPAMKFGEVVERAQRILDMRGRPPYKRFPEGDSLAFKDLSDDELALISDFVYHWLPFLMQKEKPRG